ncbi:hypothetical protein CERZMDRAFT_70522 [Cercospora zeae-maydis SCOH1-5]|uniref:Nucleolar pre-ribosomal-associated protein 1 N-terminal domain-containing protein n=1 Tax=Cercospora zeae-maydis SCOH1-5 TaxID=717836 RepID=A0A6A6F597_9PEZI|nr:hypothetical protein CERZMDRAFT_70522 [Cercospora zeae-maydis SCOH1-5]
MSKRGRQEEEGDRPPKRARSEHQPAQIFEVEYARDLQRYLVFRQDGEQQLLNGIASFKAFLESILYHKEEESRGRQISILREYLDSQKPSDPKDTEHPFLTQLWQAWSFANQNNKDHLASTVCAVLSLLLKTLSGILDLREHGLLLCRTVLQHQHLRLVKRCLDGPKHKDFIISPSLRLLIEVTSFDGGVLAREVYKRREQTFDTSTIRRNLGLAKFDLSEEDARKRPSVRILTVRYILILFKHLHEGGKIDVLKSKPLCSALFQFVHTDPADLVTELLATIEQNILKDDHVPRASKAALLTSQNLEKVTAVATRAIEEHAAADRAFAWLKAVCMNESYGALRKAGWYPAGTTEPRSKQSEDSIDLGLDSLEFYDDGEPINVRNSILLSYIATLRAHADERERELLLTCFQSAPELIAAYFYNSRLQLDPKLSNTWIGYASLMFEIVRLNAPPILAKDSEAPSIPPQTMIMIENILPRPLTLQVLNRCLSQPEELIYFFAVRILNAAMQKLNAVLVQLRSHSKGELWKQASERLVQRFVERAPKLKDVVSVFRKMPDDHSHALQRESITRLMRLYYEVIPVQALEDPVDISNALTEALLHSENPAVNANDEADGLRELELEHLLTIARHSTGMRWFHKQGGLKFTPSVLTENGILNAHAGERPASPFDALVASVTDLADGNTAWDFIDDCVGRATRKPVKYVDDLESLVTTDAALPSILAAVVLEQASFVAVKDAMQAKEEAQWIIHFLTLLQLTPDGNSVLASLSKTCTKLLAKLTKLDKAHASKALETLKELLPKQASVTDADLANDTSSAPSLLFEPPASERENHTELFRWAQKDIDLAIEDGDIAALIVCLCSERNDVRRQALTQLNKIKLQLRPSSIDPETISDDHAHISLLIGELTETFELHYLPLDKPLPYLAGTFASRALGIQTQPSHYLYAKLNHFLIRGAKWDVKRLPRYWIEKTFFSEPDDDDAYCKEVQWVLDWLVDGTRTSADLEILRKGDQKKDTIKKPEAMEMVLALWGSVGAKRNRLLRDRIAELVFRVSCVEGGGDVLITRSGGLSWLEMAKREGGEGLMEALKKRVEESCDGERISNWKGLKTTEV